MIVGTSSVEVSAQYEGTFMKPVFPVEIGAAMIEGLTSAWSGPRSETFERGMTVLRKYVPFGGAWWGLIDGPPDVAVKPSFHAVGSIDLSDAFCDEYAKMCSEDHFAAAVIAHPGVVLRWSGINEPDTPSICDWIERHQIAHGAARSNHVAFSGQALVMVLYRFKGDPGFTDDEALTMEFMVTQLEMLWAKNLQEMFRLTNAQALSGTLLAKVDGGLIYCGAKMAKRLAAIGWDQKGQIAPRALVELALTGGRVRAGQEWVVVTATAEGFHAQLGSITLTPSMPMRLLRVASMTCEGMPAKDIARELSLSPATVRTYLREVYRELGVHNKLELHGAIKSANQFM
jgi:hypothetical protein